MEITLFVIVGAIAVVSAAMMLISENAVYSALFLILNFACIAFFFLMLNAPFLAMVQITVYAGAIMVLFLFVIMLLGAESIMPESQSHFRWQLPAVIALAVLFLLAISAAIVRGDVDLIEPQVTEPHVRVVHVLDGMPEIDVYLDDVPVIQQLAFRYSTDFEVWPEGDYTVTLFAAGADPATDVPLVEQPVNVKRGVALSFVAVGRMDGTEPGLVVATDNMAYNQDKDTLHVIAINGLPDRALVDVVDETNGKQVLIDNLAYGVGSEAYELEKGVYTIGIYPDGNEQHALAMLEDETFEASTSVLWVFAEERQSDNSFRDVVINLKTEANPLFGSPTHIGRLLFTRYVLPFEMVSLLLLVAMIGAIVLTHETSASRGPTVRRLANPPAGLGQQITGESDT